MKLEAANQNVNPADAWPTENFYQALGNWFVLTMSGQLSMDEVLKRVPVEPDLFKEPVFDYNKSIVGEVNDQFPWPESFKS